MTKKSRQLAAWTGQFGNDYIERNSWADWKLEPSVEGFRRILDGIAIESILEVGSNIGLNLHYLRRVLKNHVKLYAIEPNQKAYQKLIGKSSLRLEKAFHCDAYQIPLPDSSIDLVFTKGVLIHIAPDDLGRATDEIVRVAGKYVLCMEYFSHTPVEISYRGHTGLLFKRDFGAFYLDRFPNLKCVDYGFLWQRELQVFDNIHWWLFEKMAS